jgi:hypothetical protein
MMYRYQSKILTKESPRDRLLKERTYGVTPGCIPDPKQGYRRFQRWFKLPRKAIELYWRVRGVKNWTDMRKGKHK